MNNIEPLKIQTKKVIEEYDWSNFVSQVYGKPYQLQQQSGCMDRGTISLKIPSDDYEIDFENETVPEIVNGEKMGVKFSTWLARDPKQPLKEPNDGLSEEQWAIDLWWERNFYPSLDIVAKDLHEKGLLPEGEYTIIIDW